MATVNKFPKARTQGLVVQEDAEQTLIYDKEKHQAHCLNKTAALVWRHCDGRRTPADLAAILARHLGIPDGTEVVELGLDELSRANLLEGTAPVAVAERQFTRRTLLRAGVAAVLLPMITSIMTQKGPFVSVAFGTPATTGAPPTTTTAAPTTTTAAPTTTTPKPGVTPPPVRRR